MFFKSKRDREVESLKQLIKAHEVAYDELVDFYNKRDEQLQNESRNLPVTLNFGLMDAFSVERTFQNGQPLTVVGYKLRHDTRENNITTSTYEVKEWYLNCNDEVHKDVVKQFNQYIESRKMIF